MKMETGTTVGLGVGALLLVGGGWWLYSRSKAEAGRRHAMLMAAARQQGRAAPPPAQASPFVTLANLLMGEADADKKKAACEAKCSAAGPPAPSCLTACGGFGLDGMPRGLAAFMRDTDDE